MSRATERGIGRAAQRSLVPARPIDRQGEHGSKIGSMHRRSAIIEQLQLRDLVPAPKPHTLHEALERWAAEELYTGGRAVATLAWMERHLAWLDRRAGRLDVSIRWRPIASAIHREHKPSTAMFACYMLGRVLRSCLTWGWRAEPHDLAGLCSIKSKSRKRVLSLPERVALMRAHEATATPRRKVCSELILFLLHTGWRCGEALALLARQPRTGKWVFGNRKGTGHVTPALVYQQWRLVAERLGIAGTHPHVARTTFCTVAAQMHVHPSVIAAAVGHTSEFQTMRYTHVNPDDVRLAASSIASRLQGVA